MSHSRVFRQPWSGTPAEALRNLIRANAILPEKTPAEFVTFAEENGVENAPTMRKQELMFAILKQLAIAETDINSCLRKIGRAHV